MPLQTFSASPGPSTNTKSKKRSLTEAEAEDPTPSTPNSNSKKYKIDDGVSATHKKRQKKKKRKHSIVIIDQNGSARVRDSKSKSGDDCALVVSDPASPAAIVKHTNGSMNAKGKGRESSLRALSVPNNREPDTGERDVEEIASDPKLKVSHLLQYMRVQDLGCHDQSFRRIKAK